MMLGKLWRNYRNLKRFGQIVRIVFKYGIGYVWEKRGFPSKKKFSKPQAKPLSFAQPVSPLRKVRWALEELGPAFIKLGQLLSVRPDLIPGELAEELARLQDEVPPFSPSEVRSQFIRGLGCPPENIFRKFDYRPLASASIAQVHWAVFFDGRRAAVKIQRPNLPKIIGRDLSILKDLQGLLNRSPLGRVVDVPEVISVFSRQIHRELDFTVEALNIAAFQEIFQKYQGIRIPGVYWQYTTKEILTMEFMPGFKVGNEAMKLLGHKRRAVFSKLLLQALLIPFFQAGIFHGDPHPGNVLFQADGELALVDFGIVGRLDDVFRYQVAQLLLAVNDKDAGRVVDLTMKFGVVFGPFSPSKLYEDIAELLDKACRMNNGVINLGHLINGMINISLQHHIKMPGSFFILGKAILTAEGLAKRLDPHVNVMEVAKPLAVEYLKNRLEPNLATENIYRRTADFWEALSSFPKYAGQVLSNLAKGEQDIVFVHRGLETLYNMLDIVSTRLSVSLVVGALIVGSAVIIAFEVGPRWGGYSFLGLTGFSISSVLGFWLVWGMLRHGKLK